MSLKIRRGLELDLPVSPDDGELLYATDSNKLFVGFGGTANEISGGSGGGLGNVVEDTTPQLGGDLDINGYGIVSTDNSDISIDPNGTGNIILHGGLIINAGGNISKDGILNITPTSSVVIGSNDTLTDGNLTIIRNSYNSDFNQGIVFSQHHATADAVNFNFYRTRGTNAIPTAVQTGDDLAEFGFAGHDGSQRQMAGFLSVKVSGVVSTGIVPGEFVFALRNQAGSIGEKAKLTSEGILNINSIENLSGTSLSLTAATVSVTGDIQINAQGDLRFADSDSSNYIAFQAPAELTGNVTWTLPGTDGAGGQVLSTNGAGTLAWETITPTPSRIELAGETAPLADTETGNTAITGFKGYMLYKIQVNHAAWVRIYTDVASRDADAGRAEGEDPLPGAGVIAEIITSSADTILLTPGVIGFNNESPVTNVIPVAVTNKSGSSTTITVTLTLLQLEA